MNDGNEGPAFHPGPRFALPRKKGGTWILVGASAPVRAQGFWPASQAALRRL